MFTQLSSVMKAAIYYGLAFGLVLLLALFGQGLGEDILPIVMFTPLMAVLLMQWVVTRDGYHKVGWQILGWQRAGLGSWGLALWGPLLVLSITYAIVWGSGLGRFARPADQGAVDMILNLVIMLLINVLFAFGEEIGWRGYLLPHLQTLGRTRALLLSGFLHGCWHLPVLLLTPFYHSEGSPWIVVPLFLLTLTGAGVFFGYLRLSSGSTWPAALAHGAWNTFWGQFTTLTLAVGSPVLLEYLAGESGVLTLVGVTVMAVWLLHRLPLNTVSSALLVSTVQPIGASQVVSA